MSQRVPKQSRPEPGGESYEFGRFCLNPSEGVLSRDGRSVSLTPKAFEILTVLVRNGGHLVCKEELLREVWPDAFVEEANITQHISLLRKALGEGAGEPQYIETVPRRGYRFVASVRRAPGEGAEVAGRRDVAPPVSAKRDSEMGAPGRAVEREPTARPQSPGAGRWPSARSRLGKGLLTALAVATGLTAALFYLRGARGPEPRGAAAPVRTIAVLPFASIGAAVGDEYLELGMADALITRLSNVRRIVVRPTSAVSRYVGAPQDAIAAGRELGVDAVLDGSVQKLDARVRITVRLIRVADAAPLWAETFDERWTDVFGVQSSIAQKVTEALALKLSGQERDLLVQGNTRNVEAYQLNLKGRYSSNKWTAEGFMKAVEYFNQAIALDPAYALAYAGLAHSYYGLAHLGALRPREALPKMKEMATKAVALDGNLAEARGALAVALIYNDWNWADAETEIRRAVALNPNSAQIHLFYGDLLSCQGRSAEAISEYQTAQQLDPTSRAVNGSLAYHFLRAGDYDKAIEESRRALELDPENPWSLGALAFAYLYKGELPRALEMFQRIGNEEGIGRAHAAMGNRGEAVQAIERLKEKRGQKIYVPSNIIASVYLQLGDKERAIEYLERAYEERIPYLDILKTDRQFDVLRTDPRFIRLMRRMNFEP